MNYTFKNITDNNGLIQGVASSKGWPHPREQNLYALHLVYLSSLNPLFFYMNIIKKHSDHGDDHCGQEMVLSPFLVQILIYTHSGLPYKLAVE